MGKVWYNFKVKEVVPNLAHRLLGLVCCSGESKEGSLSVVYGSVYAHSIEWEIFAEEKFVIYL